MEISFEKGKFVYCPGGFNYQEVLDDFKRAKKSQNNNIQYFRNRKYGSLIGTNKETGRRC